MSLLTDEEIEKILDEYEKPENYSLYHQLCMQPVEVQAEFWKDKTDEEIEALMYDLEFVGNANQQPIPEDQFMTLLNFGRGSGKSFFGGACVARWALAEPNTMIAIVGDSDKDIREVMIPSIRERTPPSVWKNVDHNKATHVLTYPNGSTVYSYKANVPSQLRGPSVSYIWLDEVVKFSYLDEVLVQCSAIMRTNQFIDKGRPKQMVITSTPEATAAMLALRDDPQVTVINSTTFENGAISRQDKKRMLQKLGRTKKGRVELFGEWVEDVDGALWKQSDIDESRLTELPCALHELDEIIVSVDPSGSEKKRDLAGITVIGRLGTHAYILEDASIQGNQQEWGSQVVKMFYKWGANYVLYESNGIGQATPVIIHTIDEMIPMKGVTASESKGVRADPVALLYLHHRVHHVGDANNFAELEDQMCTWEPLKTKKSPDRIDSLVHGVGKLLLKQGVKASFF